MTTPALEVIKQLDASGYSTRMELLSALDSSGPCPQRRVSELVGVSQPAGCIHVRNLVRDKLCAPVAQKGKTRPLYLVTPKGHEVVLEYRAKMRRAVAKLAKSAEKKEKGGES